MSGYYQPDTPAFPAVINPPPQFYAPPNNSLSGAQKLSSSNLTRWFDRDSEASVAGPKGGAVRVRRRPTVGSDHVKHRRTRSGCFTCRNRRVKCDEQRPICERCKKGSRECVYPEPSSATKSTSSSKLGQQRNATQESESSSGEYEDEDGELSPLGTKDGIPNLRGTRPSVSSQRSTSRRQSRQEQARKTSISDSHLKENSLSPSTDESGIPESRSTTATVDSSGKASASTSITQDSGPWSHLPQDIQFYLNYHQNSLNYRHYSFKHDADFFLHSALLQSALQYPPLLYAVVGFAAFQCTLQKPNGRIEDFLGYYNKSVQLLRKSLQAAQKHTDATILTVLQLAAFEEYLGDWVNLLSHQKASYEMLLELYTPETIMQTETSRKILSWYVRFDLYAGIMAGSEIVLGRAWFVACRDHYRQKLQREPGNSSDMIDENIAIHRLAAMDMAAIVAKVARGVISIPEFLTENQKVSDDINRWKQELQPLLASTEHVVTSFDGNPKLDPDDIVNPYSSDARLYIGPLWGLNLLLVDWFAIDGMHKSQTALILGKNPPPVLQQYALELCKIFERIEYWPESPTGAMLPVQGALGLACLWLPHDEKNTMWCRRKLAKIESQGYIYPPAYRAKMAEQWDLPELNQWWLPNQEGYPPIIKSIRAFIQERTQKPRNQTSEDLRSMKGMFSKLNFMDDSPMDSPESNSSGTGEASNYGDLASMVHTVMPEISLEQMDLALDPTMLENWNMIDLKSEPGFYMTPNI